MCTLTLARGPSTHAEFVLEPVNGIRTALCVMIVKHGYINSVLECQVQYLDNLQTRHVHGYATTVVFHSLVHRYSSHLYLPVTHLKFLKIMLIVITTPLMLAPRY